ncbi:MAG: cobalamin-dependent protein [Desulfatitalea sp.]|nr:cobalamin-dependent protein [Desulfatitalea sp.]
MNIYTISLRRHLAQLSRRWIEHGLPPRQEILKSVESVLIDRQANGTTGLWSPAPFMLTATVDDGIGQGLDVIERYAGAMGVRVQRLGLVLAPDTIITACRTELPDYLGLTVLQVDSETALSQIAAGITPKTRLIAGGPAFRYDRELGERCGVHFVAANVAYFIDYLLKR